MQPEVRSFHHQSTGTWSHLVIDPATREAAIIDPVWEFDVASGRLTEVAPAIVDAIESDQLQVVWVLETHVHADHLSAAQPLAERFGARVGIGAGVLEVQERFRQRFNAEACFCPDGSQFDVLFADGDPIQLGTWAGEVIATPGHTPSCVTYRFGDAAFVGDTLFMPDYGTARTDFPGGCAHRLYASIQRILALPDHTQLYMCHDYGTAERSERLGVTTVTAQRENCQLAHIRDAAHFATERNQRDQGLSAPKLLYPAVNFNMRGGRLPPPAENGNSYLPIPVTIATNASA